MAICEGAEIVILLDLEVPEILHVVVRLAKMVELAGIDVESRRVAAPRAAHAAGDVRVHGSPLGRSIASRLETILHRAPIHGRRIADLVRGQVEGDGGVGEIPGLDPSAVIDRDLNRFPGGWSRPGTAPLARISIVLLKPAGMVEVAKASPAFAASRDMMARPGHPETRSARATVRAWQRCPYYCTARTESRRCDSRFAKAR